MGARSSIPARALWPRLTAWRMRCAPPPISSGDLQPYNADASESLSVRIGIHAGEPVEDHSDLFGATVQLASRLCSEAEANGIVVSGFVRELCDDRFVALRGARRAATEGLPR